MSIDFTKENFPVMHGEYPPEVEYSGGRDTTLRNTLDEAIQWFTENLPYKEDYGQMVGAESWTWGSYYVYSEPDGYFMEYAIRCMQELSKLKQLYDSKNLVSIPVTIGDLVYTVKDREVKEHKVTELQLKETGIEVVLDNQEHTTMEEYNQTWFTDKDQADTTLSNLELVRIGLLG